MAAHRTLAAWCILSLLSFASLAHGCIPCGTEPPPAMPPPAKKSSCPTLKLGVCVDLLGGVVGLPVGTLPDSKCCALIQGLADLEAALCLCIAIKANVLGLIKLDVPVALSWLVNACGKKVPDGFKCA